MGQFQGYTDRQLSVLEAAGLEVIVRPKQAEKGLEEASKKAAGNKAKNN